MCLLLEKLIYLEQLALLALQVTFINNLGLQLHNCHIFYLDFTQKLYIYLGQFPFKQELLLKYELFLDSSIKLRYKKVINNTNQQGAESVKTTPCQERQKKKKVKERTIKYATECVKLWRNLYELVDNKGKRIHTLESAAQVVGLAKKTLDDYYYQLRQA